MELPTILCIFNSIFLCNTTPIMPTNELIGKRYESTTIERVRIIKLHEEGFSQQDITKQLKIPKTTIY